MPQPSLYEHLNRRWLSACKILFGQEVGELKDYRDWLLEGTEPTIQRKSSVSGKPVSYANEQYPENSRWIGFEELDFGKKFEPLNINQAKDIDSIVEAVQERIYYCGNTILGNSGYVEKSAGITDSFYVLEANRFGESKYIVYTSLGRLCEDCFGCNAIGTYSTHCIRCRETYRDKRCFELWMSQNCSDSYYSYGILSCQDCMFSFYLKNKRHAIGNLELEAGKYLEIKKKLLEEMAEELKKKKRLPSIIEIAEKAGKEKPRLKLEEEKEEKTDKSIIEREFSKTTQLLFGKPLPGGIDSYSEWLKRHTRKMEKCSSCLSGKAIYRYDYSNYLDLPGDRLITVPEGEAISQQAKASEEEVEKASFPQIHRLLSKISFFTTEYWEGANSNLIECATSSSSNNCYRSAPIIHSKYCGYCFWPRESERMFGCEAVFNSDFCINAYLSTKLKRCFEMDFCRSCSDSLFCHNAENVQDSMFCFNVKNLRYAIGNAEYPAEVYKKLKASVISQLYEELEKKKSLHLDVYSIGSFKK